MGLYVKALQRASIAVFGLCVVYALPARADLHPRVRAILAQVQSHFGRPVTVTSGCRSRNKNRMAGGARSSLHLNCMAADFRVAGVSEGAVLRYVKKLPRVGGVGTYCRNGIVHVDIGAKRQWHEPCRRNIFKRKRGTRIARR